MRMRSTGRGASDPTPTGALTGRLAAAQTSNGTAKAKTLPLSTLLVTQMRPPISSTRRLEMVSPRPEPPNRRVVDESAWVKRSKTRASLSPEMPMPVSVTVNRRAVGTAASSSRSTFRETSPVAVNLIALPSKLSSTWRSRVGSPTRSLRTLGAISQIKVSPFSRALGATISMTFSKWSLSENPVCSRSSCDASTLERSRMSLIKLSKLSPERRNIWTYLSCSGVSEVLARRSATPMIAFIGVRISWLILARKSDFVRLALSAAALAS